MIFANRSSYIHRTLEKQFRPFLQIQNLIIANKRIATKYIIQHQKMSLSKTSLPASPSSPSTTLETSFATADICDLHIPIPKRLSIVEPCTFHSYGRKTSFCGPIETIRCFESNPLVRETLSTKGNGRVLVVDGGGSKRCAILGKGLNPFIY